MLRHLKKFVVYSSVIVAGQASRALDDPISRFPPLTECVQIFDQCYDPDNTTNLDLSYNGITGPIPAEIGLLTALEDLRVSPASPTPGAARD